MVRARWVCAEGREASEARHLRVDPSHARHTHSYSHMTSSSPPVPAQQQGRRLTLRGLQERRRRAEEAYVAAMQLVKHWDRDRRDLEAVDADFTVEQLDANERVMARLVEAMREGMPKDSFKVGRRRALCMFKSSMHDPPPRHDPSKRSVSLHAFHPQLSYARYNWGHWRQHRGRSHRALDAKGEDIHVIVWDSFASGRHETQYEEASDTEDAEKTRAPDRRRPQQQQPPQVRDERRQKTIKPESSNYTHTKENPKTNENVYSRLSLILFAVAFSVVHLQL